MASKTPPEGVLALRPRRRIRAFFACLAIVYLLVYPYLQGINNPNENTRVYLTMALVEHRSFHVDEIVRRHGWTNDLAKVQTAGGPRYASVKGPLVSYLGVPVYAARVGLGKILGKPVPSAFSPKAEREAWLRSTTILLQLVVVHVPCLLFLVAFERVLRAVTADVLLRLSAVAAVGLGTNYLAYSFVFASHALIAGVAFFAFGRVFLDRLIQRGDAARASPKHAFVVGLALGGVTLLEYQALLVSVVLGLYAVTIYRTRRTLSALVVGVVPSVLGLLLFQAKSFGNAFTPGHRMMDSDAFQALNSKGFFTLGTPSWEALTGLLFDGGYGLFGASPYLLLALLAVIPFRRSRDERRRAVLVCLVVFGALVLPVSASSIWRGGWTIGPRYLGALPPFLAFAAVVGLARHARISRRVRAVLQGAAGGLAAASFASIGLVALVVSTLPEAVARPLPQVAWPFLRAGRVPHHALEVLGIVGSWPFYLAPLAAVGALVLTVSRWDEEGRARLAAAGAGAALVLAFALRVPVEAAPATEGVRALFARVWEPAGRGGP